MVSMEISDIVAGPVLSLCTMSVRSLERYATKSWCTQSIYYTLISAEAKASVNHALIDHKLN